jgi:hypothetical protein
MTQINLNIQQNIGGAHEPTEPSVQIIGGAQAQLPIGVYAYVRTNSNTWIVFSIGV